MPRITFVLIFLLSISYSNESVSDDLAYQLVVEKINKKIVPIAYIDEIFKNEKIERHKKIPESFARPYEKKSWEQYKKLFIKESRIVAGNKFYSENRDLILKVSKAYDVDPFIILSIAGIESNYGKHYKGFTVFNSLYTQIHDMPKRAKWASKELASYLEYLGLQNRKSIAIALNGEVVPRTLFPQTKISVGDSLEIVRAIGGG